ncbi:MAG: DUF86 domain-containing protein [Chloroflexi bacterium HGW-Chloroflexi-1]|nr:MAG: DUF86 domain-containing protein [Chloroflexi bacterium HGW-Chloroflexi-1]
MVDLDKLEGIFRNLDRCQAILRDLAQLPKADLLSDLGRLGGAKYYLQVAVECCVDAANHLISRQNWRAPKSHSDSFVILAENGVIPTEFLRTTRQMVGMRNRLVHLYWEVDAETVYETLQNNLGDFDRFEAAVFAYLRRIGVMAA